MKVRHSRGESTLELTVSIFLALLLLVATARVFVWLNDKIVRRQIDYEATRIVAGSVEPGTQETEIQVDETNYPRLKIFENWPSSR